MNVLDLALRLGRALAAGAILCVRCALSVRHPSAMAALSSTLRSMAGREPAKDDDEGA